MKILLSLVILVSTVSSLPAASAGQKESLLAEAQKFAGSYVLDHCVPETVTVHERFEIQVAPHSAQPEQVDFKANFRRYSRDEYTLTRFGTVTEKYKDTSNDWGCRRSTTWITFKPGYLEAGRKDRFYDFCIIPKEANQSVAEFRLLGDTLTISEDFGGDDKSLCVYRRQ